MSERDIVERLRDHLHFLQRDGLTALLKTGEEAADEIDRLREALRPFGTALKGNWSNQPDSMVIVAGTPTDLRFSFLLHDFRQAKAALKERGDE